MSVTRLALPCLFLVACKTDGDLYGGGRGLTVHFEPAGGSITSLSWPGAARSDLREVNGGLFDSETTWDPVAQCNLPQIDLGLDFDINLTF